MSCKISKEESELYDAISREVGEPMSPYEELVLLGVYEAEFELEPEPEAEACEEFLDYDEGYEIPQEDEYEEYEHYGNDRQYRMLEEVMEFNNNRRKYFA